MGVPPLCAKLRVPEGGSVGQKSAKNRLWSITFEPHAWKIWDMVQIEGLGTGNKWQEVGRGRVWHLPYSDVRRGQKVPHVSRYVPAEWSKWKMWDQVESGRYMVYLRFPKGLGGTSYSCAAVCQKPKKRGKNGVHQNCFGHNFWTSGGTTLKLTSSWRHLQGLSIGENGFQIGRGCDVKVTSQFFSALKK